MVKRLTLFKTLIFLLVSVGLTNPKERYGNLKLEGKELSWIELGGQIWSKNNLDPNWYSLKDSLFLAIENSEWKKNNELMLPSYCLAPDSSTYLFNWFAVEKIAELLPDSVEVASSLSYQGLFRYEEYLYGTDYKKDPSDFIMKSAELGGFNIPEVCCFRNSKGEFIYKDMTYTYWVYNTDSIEKYSVRPFIVVFGTHFGRLIGPVEFKDRGHPVRLVKKK